MKKSVLSFIASRYFKKGLLFLLLCGLFGWALSSSSMFESLNEQWIDLHIRNNGLQGAVYFMLIGALATAIGCPRQLVAFLGGYAFGAVNGALLSTLGVGMGCVLSLYFARIVIRPFVNRRFPNRIIKINDFLSVRPVVKTIVIRLLPIGNNLVTNLIAGVTAVKARYFVLGSLIGYIPQMAIFALMGKGVVVMSVWKIGLSIVLFIISSALSVRLYREYRAVQLLGRGQVEDSALAAETISQ
jgi:uncharacterized membrane protein YdjX (TVP38/TMEM64 family)